MPIVLRRAPSPRFFFSALFAVAGFAEERPAAESLAGTCSSKSRQAEPNRAAPAASVIAMPRMIGYCMRQATLQ
ncbi:hypothetical protein GOC91_11715 [Sinorhizobium medicae]|uniref:Uncharacterized protein n=2 Tax=Sinorhizobium medicae TaxID=110321 RepID=A0A6G1WEB2_9HYPH|nr:hypothetical protein Smed_2288 [Sinorhizobium medicae WSM419]MDX0405609.1 hypothetical protein [Sinorhizobium medicae]MDX0411129.1 hypothetical protein [Sinorhizobium medicae]MDX0417583.1 hypothetical protein [Sinorhizobium medicae]MDX0422634.1 hypothetical protein [Sinorhizobium medicae]